MSVQNHLPVSWMLLLVTFLPCTRHRISDQTGAEQLHNTRRQRRFLAHCRYIVQTYARPPVVFTHGEGPRQWDAFGKEYLDFAGGIAVNALGASLTCHAHWLGHLHGRKGLESCERLPKKQSKKNPEDNIKQRVVVNLNTNYTAVEDTKECRRTVKVRGHTWGYPSLDWGGPARPYACPWGWETIHTLVIMCLWETGVTVFVG
jgi:hypothetical protein